MAQWQINGGDSRKDTMFDESKKLDILAASCCLRNKNFKKIARKLKFSGLNFLVIVANFCSKAKQRSCVYYDILNSSNSGNLR